MTVPKLQPTPDSPATTATMNGLSSRDAAARLIHDGGNVLPSARPTPLWRRITTQLRDPLVLVLLAAAVFTLATADFTDAAVILLVIVVNTTVGVMQEIKAERAITALSALTAPAARVIRDGNQCEVPAADLVVEDLLVLAEGDVVPADARVVESVALLVDEAALTGESAPVDKSARTDSGAMDAVAAAVVSAGTVVVRGRGHAVVTATGAASAMGRIAAMLVTSPGLTPLQRRLAGVGRQLAVGALLLCGVVLALGLVRGQPLQLMIVTAISLVVAAVPESLPAVVTLSLTLGARRMTARHAVIRRLPAVETLGSVTILATDKTGTLTEGTMVVRQLWTTHGDASVRGSGFAPDGEIHRSGDLISPDQAPDLVELVQAAVLCSDASLRPPGPDNDDWLAVGDPTEAALLTVGGKLGIDVDALHQALPRQGEAPFDSDRKRMSTAHLLPGGRVQVVCKGARSRCYTRRYSPITRSCCARLPIAPTRWPTTDSGSSPWPRRTAKPFPTMSATTSETFGCSASSRSSTRRAPPQPPPSPRARKPASPRSSSPATIRPPQRRSPRTSASSSPATPRSTAVRPIPAQKPRVAYASSPAPPRSRRSPSSTPCATPGKSSR
jgi:Ca2+-transporting ATPase